MPRIQVQYIAVSSAPTVKSEFVKLASFAILYGIASPVLSHGTF